MRGIVILRTSPFGYSRKFVFKEFCELRHNGVLRSSPIRLCEVHTIPIDSLRVFSEKAAIVCLFGARRLSQQAYASFPEPRKGAYPYVRRYRTSVDYFGTLRRAQTTRQPYSPECVEGRFCELRLLGILRSSLPASNAQATPKIAHLSDTSAPIWHYATPVTDKGTP